MKMLTLNCHSLQGFDTNKQINEFVDQVVRENIAIFALQEANQPRKSACVTAEELRDLKYVKPCEEEQIPVKIGNFAYLLQKALRKVKLDFYWSWCACHELLGSFDEGLALFSLVPLSEVTADILAPEREIGYQDIRRHKILAGKLANTEGSLVVTTHLDGQLSNHFNVEWDTFSKRLQFLGAKKRPTYVLANVNVDAEEDVIGYEYMCRSFQDTYVAAINKSDGLTIRDNLTEWGQKSLARRIDYILTNAKHEIVSSRVCFDGHESQKISNHAAVIIEIEDQEGQLYA